MNDTIKASLEAIDAECENAAQAELDELSKSMPGDGATFQPPSPQAVEAIWLRLVARKEQEFVQAVMGISRISGPKPEPVPRSTTSDKPPRTARNAFMARAGIVGNCPNPCWRSIVSCTR